MTRNSTIVGSAAAFAALFAAQSALAGSHSWRINELFSTPDGSIQFIEMWEAFGEDMEIFLPNHHITSEATGADFNFPEIIDPPTTNKHLLLATQSFADLPGAPVPDYIIPPNFFDPSGDTLHYHVYDEWTFGKGEVPTNCVDSLHRNFRRTPSIGPNSPTNYLFESGEVAACLADLSGDGLVTGIDLALLLGQWGACPTAGAPGTCSADLDGNGLVNGIDLAILLGAWS